MNVEIFYHGVPNAFSEWGTTKGDSMQRYYANVGNIKENIRFSIELGKIEQRYCIYYSYLRYNNVKDSTGRDGAYFGFTIRFDDMYCTDVEPLFRICDTIYGTRICNTIVKQNGGAIQFLISNYPDKKTLLQQINQEITNKISSLSFASIVLPTGSPSQQPMQFNVAETGSQYFWQMFYAAGKVLVSPDYPLRDQQLRSMYQKIEPEKQKNHQLTEENVQLRTQNSELGQTNLLYRQSVDTLTKEKQQLETETSSLRDEVQKLKSELGKKQAHVNIEQALAHIQQPLNELLNAVRSFAPKTQPHPLQDKRNLFFTRLKRWVCYAQPVVNSILHIAGICILVFCLLQITKVVNGVSPNAETKVELLERNNRLYGDSIQRLNKSIQHLQKENADLRNKEIANNSQTAAPQRAKNEDCKISISSKHLGTLLNSCTLSENDTITIQWEPKSQYKWYTDNLNEEQKKQLNGAQNGNATIVVKRSDKSKSQIVLAYRTATKADANDRNKVVLTINK